MHMMQLKKTVWTIEEPGGKKGIAPLLYEFYFYYRKQYQKDALSIGARKLQLCWFIWMLYKIYLCLLNQFDARKRQTLLLSEKFVKNGTAPFCTGLFNFTLQQKRKKTPQFTKDLAVEV